MLISCWVKIAADDIFIPHHTIVVGYYGFMLAVCVSISRCKWIFAKFGMCINIMSMKLC